MDEVTANQFAIYINNLPSDDTRNPSLSGLVMNRLYAFGGALIIMQIRFEGNVLRPKKGNIISLYSLNALDLKSLQPVETRDKL